MLADFLTHLHDMMVANMWGVYLGIFLAPFMQEDAAVISAAGLSLAAMGEQHLIFAAISAGLISSDLWKYWLGRAARTQGWARRFAAKPAIAKAEALVKDKLAVTLMTVRFIPGARIAFYIAAGYFNASWLRFAFWIVVSALVYILVVFGFFHAVGMVAGEQAKVWLPGVAIVTLFGYLLMRWASRSQALEATTEGE